MAFALGPVLLLTVVGAAVFGGLDVRKKKKNGAKGNGALPNGDTQPNDEQQLTTVPCAHVLDVNGDESMVSVDGGPWVATGTMDDFDTMSFKQGKPIVLFLMCEPDPLALQALDNLCVQQPGVEFYGAYTHRIPAGPVRQRAVEECGQRNMLVGFSVSTPSADGVRSYDFMDIPELGYHPGGNIAQVFANVLAAAAGVDDPRSDFWTKEELGV